MNIQNTVIFGQGKVGIATDHILETRADFHDPRKGLIIQDFSKYDLAMICVSSLVNGPDDHQDIIQCLDMLKNSGFTGLAAIRCTVGPDFLDNVEQSYPDLKIIHFPEFMRQRDNDIVDLPWITVLGGDIQHTQAFGEWLVNQGYGTREMLHCVSFAESALIKLYQNAALAMKVTFANLVYETCARFSADYQKVKLGIGADRRIGHHHMNVPGEDGFGFAGHCLPKDVECINASTDSHGFWSTIISINQLMHGKNKGE
jgi:UDP-glucose 6-dehydrogenase